MNVNVPWKDGDDLSAFFGILGSLLGFCVIAFAVAKFYRWW